MKQKIISSVLAIGVLMLAGQAQNIQLSKVFADAEKQTQLMLQEIPKAKSANADLVSPRTLNKGELKWLLPATGQAVFPG